MGPTPEEVCQELEHLIATLQAQEAELRILKEKLNEEKELTSSERTTYERVKHGLARQRARERRWKLLGRSPT